MLKIPAALLAFTALVGIALTSVEPASAGGGCRGVPVTEAAGTTVVTEGTCFVPTVLYVQAGETVTWTNPDVEPHSVTGANAAWGDYLAYGFGESVSHEFETAGAYSYYCFIHPGMVGTIVVEDGNGDLTEGASISREGLGQPVDDVASNSTSRSSVTLVAGVAALVAVAAAIGGVGFAFGRRRPGR